MKVKLCILIGGDLSLAVLALYTGLVVRFGPGGINAHISGNFPVKCFLFVLVLLLTSDLFELYDLGKHRVKKNILINILTGVVISFIILSTVFFISPDFTIGRGLLAISLLAFVFYQYSWHVLFSLGVGHPILAERILVLGTGALAVKVGHLIQSSIPRFNHTMVGYVACEEGTEENVVSASEVIGKAPDLMAIAVKEKVSKIVVSLLDRGGVFSARNVLLNCKLHGIEVLDTPSFYEQVTGKLMLEHMHISWLIYSTGFKRTALISAVKRMVDVSLAVLGIIMAFPLLPFIALLVKLDSPGPVFFSQLRVGQGEENFTLYKFRTMSQNVEDETGAAWAQEDDPRINPIGAYLRKFRLDELPQLYNILRGDMSFIGPRPERPEFVEKLDQVIPFYRKRHYVKPGLTGWAQVKFGYGSTVDDAYEKLRYDLYYIKNMSLFLDTLILLKTFKVVIFGRGGR